MGCSGKMNARQKAKKYKQRCELLEKCAIPTKMIPIDIHNYPIVELYAEQLVDTADLMRWSGSEENIYTMINKSLAGQFMHQILRYAEIDKLPNPYGYDYDKVLIRAKMKVVNLMELNSKDK